MEFHISREVREKLDLDDLLFSYTGNVVFANIAAARRLAQSLNQLDPAEAPETTVNAGALFAMGLIDELSHALIARYRAQVDPNVLSDAISWFGTQVEPAALDALLLAFTERFPNTVIYRGELTPQQWLAAATENIPNREAAFEELLLLWLANANPAFEPFGILFADASLMRETAYPAVTAALPTFFNARPPVAPGLGSLLEVLRSPALASPDSLTGQLDYIRENWSEAVGADLRRVLLAIDTLREEEVAIWMRFHPPVPGQYRDPTQGGGPEGFVEDEFVGYDEFTGEEYVIGTDGVRRRRYAADYQAPLNEYEAFSADQAWMPTVVLMAKSTYVWLEQLSKKYLCHIHRLDQIPDEELQLLASRGMTGLWLIGLWERSKASQTIKRLCGNPDAVASAYSLRDYSIAEDLGGESAYQDLRDRAARAGLRLASDMVPNHMGIDSTWVVEHPEWFITRSESPFPSYRFEGPDLSPDPRVEIKIEDHYYDQSDAAVVFRLRHFRDNSTRFMYHGNDGTTFAWNDTAQLDYSKAQVREHVMQVILDVARRFPIIRFDAAMVLAKRHVQRLWFPLPGAGGSIPSRAEDAMSQEAFDELMPHEFWREVVDRVAVEVPGTLLLAEAFWLLESYFVRTLGMHRVYNSAFMNMLRDEENAKYRSYLKKTVEFDPDILKRYVNFMSNPDEKTAVDQFGTGDKYFGTSVLLATLPGLPMFGHGQVEGFAERYGMDFKQARLDETPNEGLIARHNHLIAPLLKNRHVFAESTYFTLYDFWTEYGTVDENVFAYSNRSGDQRAIIFYNNAYNSTQGTIHHSVGFLEKSSGALQMRSLADGLDLPNDDFVLSYRDTVDSLEYLRRARDLRNQGLTLSLRGYQHVVLMNWRVLRPTAEQPWDRLCDALKGSGVYSVDESLSQLRLRPLHDALRQAICPTHIQVFAQLAAEAEIKPGASASLKESANSTAPLRKAAAKKPAKPSAKEPKRHIQNGSPSSFLSAALAAAPDPRLHDFLAKAQHFADLATQYVSPADTSHSQHDCIADAIAAPSLPALLPHFPATLQRAAACIIPTAASDEESRQLWGPILAWIVIQSFPKTLRTKAFFDELRIKSALGETFSSLGIKNETAWRAAARIGTLITFPATAAPIETLRQPAFWAEPDVRWLAGLHEAFGTTYFNQEAFEELICWLYLPQLLHLASTTSRSKLSQPLAEITALVLAARDASYNLDQFLSFLEPSDPAPKPARAKAKPKTKPTAN